MADLAGLDQFDDFGRGAEDGVAAEADQDGFFRFIFRESGGGQGGVDDRFEVAVGDVDHTRPGHETAGEDPALVGFRRFLDTVRGHQDRAGEGGEFFLLILPGAAVVADKMFIFLQPGVAMGRQHFAVCINVDAGSLGLFEQFFQILQIMAGNQNRLAFDRGDADRRRHGVAVSSGIRFIEQFHDPDVDFAAAQRHAQQRIHAEVRLGQEVERLMEERVDLRVLLVEDPRMVGVSGHSFQTVYDQVFQADQIGAAGGNSHIDGNGLALGDQTVQIGGRRPGGRSGQGFGSFAGFQRGGFIQGFGFGLDFGALADDSCETLGIEVDVGDGGKQSFDDIFVNDRILGAEHGGAVGVH